MRLGRWDAGTAGRAPLQNTHQGDGADPNRRVCHQPSDSTAFLTCSACDGLFPRPARGRPPKRCDPCRGIKGADTTPTDGVAAVIRSRETVTEPDLAGRADRAGAGRWRQRCGEPRRIRSPA